ncbi:integrin alpha-4 [Rhinatrema bivittatum]|uniref:integrin alpha-4 n=1 Tax=Rhinatrema bivittatum TaxID=194408 RepID=UPI00112795F8|nr:integrin alpha-4 [Rhinatrema bivittatum]
MDWEKLLKVLKRANIWSVILLYGLIRNTEAYNIDVGSPLIFKGFNGSLFGYSVLLHSHGDHRWLVVGAPKSNWPANESVITPGAIFKCRIGDNPNGTCDQLQLGSPVGDYCGKTCIEERDNQWMGVSLSRQPKADGSILACGHRWKNIFYMKKEHKFPYGVCYGIPPDFRTEVSQRICPCYRDHMRKFGESHGSCQAGISSFHTENLIIMGAPGSYYWTGSVFVYNTTENTYKTYEDVNNSVKFGSYLGYSVGAGHYLSPSSTEVIGGAPQQEQTGRAYIFTIDSSQLNILFEATGKKLGSYFGAAVCAVDLNADGLSDLLVGAPMQSTVREEGRVFVYINMGFANMRELEMELSGSDSYAARFGESIASLGDIDNDGFEDVAIGAPQEDDLQGAIYIYNGRQTGITSSFTQRIEGHRVGSTLSMFGQSISGSIDTDGNGYPDVAVGAFLSDSAVLLRTRAVVIVEASLKHSNSVNRTKLECVENGQPTVCINVTLCFMYKGREVPGHIVLHYNVTIDVNRKVGSPARFYFSSNGTSDVTSGSTEIYKSRINCKTHAAFMKKDIRDILTPIHLEAAYHLGDHIVKKRSTEELPPLQPILQQGEGKDTVLKSKVVFARFCAQEDCFADLQISGKVAFPKPYENKTYLAVGSMKILMLNISLFNAGDDAYQTELHILLPRGLYFIKVLEQEVKQIICEVSEEEKTMMVKLDCSLGHLYISSLSKVGYSFLLDASSLTQADDDLNITVNATCDNEGNKANTWNNFASFTVPLRYEVQLNVHGSVSPSSFVYGSNNEYTEMNCITEKINFTFHVINVGSSVAPTSNLEIMLPNSFAPNNAKLFNLLHVKTSAGECYFKNYTTDCTLPETHRSLLQDLFIFFSKPGRRRLYCMKEDSLCLQIHCKFGKMESGREENVQVSLEVNLANLEMDHALILQFITRATVSTEKHPKVIQLHRDPFTNVILEGLHHQKPKHRVTRTIIVISFLVGFILFLFLAYGLWKVGFFKRPYKPLAVEVTKRESWRYVDSNKDED